jgi:hypothetical protein
MAALVIFLLILVPALVIYLWWRLFNTPNGERYIKMRLQGPFTPLDADDATHGTDSGLGKDSQVQAPMSTHEAQMAVIEWLTLADSESYSSSWEHASDIFKRAINMSEWAEKMRLSRAPFAGVKLRNLQSAIFTKSLPGVPDGEYVVVKYKTQFEHKMDAVETVATLKDTDGIWRVTGYYIN